MTAASRFLAGASWSPVGSPPVAGRFPAGCRPGLSPVANRPFAGCGPLPGRRAVTAVSRLPAAGGRRPSGPAAPANRPTRRAAAAPAPAAGATPRPPAGIRSPRKSPARRNSIPQNCSTTTRPAARRKSRTGGEGNEKRLNLARKSCSLHLGEALSPFPGRLSPRCQPQFGEATEPGDSKMQWQGAAIRRALDGSAPGDTISGAATVIFRYARANQQ